MRVIRSFCTGLSCLVAALVLSVPATAAAEDGPAEYPLVKAQRPLALYPGKLRVDIPLEIRNLPAMSTGGSDEIGVFFHGAAEYGILRGLTVGGEIFNVQFAPDADFLNPNIFALYQFLHGNFEMGARLRATLPIEKAEGTTIEIELPFGLVLTEAAYLEFVPGFGVNFPESGDAQTSFALAAQLTANLTRALFLHARLGFGYQPLSVKDAWGIPVGAGVGYTLGEGNDPMMDIFVNFDLNPVYTKAADEANADNWSLTFGVNWFVL